MSSPTDFKPRLQNPEMYLNFAGIFSVDDNTNQALPAPHFKVSEFGGPNVAQKVCSERCGTTPCRK